MDGKAFRTNGYEMVEYVAKYMETIQTRDCLPQCEPGYCAKIVPKEAPEKPEKFEAIMKDLEKVVMEGMAHWNHPHFHAYFPSGNCWATILAGIFSNGTGIVASTWETCPAATELEIIVMDWVCKFLGLPDFFLSNFSNPESKGGGVIQASASECIMLSMIAARELGVKKLRKLFPAKPRAVILSMLIGYTNNQSHSSVEKGAMIANCTLRFLPPGTRGQMSATALKEAIKEDKAKGLYPFFVSAILGSTGLCVFDDLTEIGPICADHDMWLHVDCAYAGSCFACPEMRYLMKGMEYVWSMDANANKWLLTSFDCSMHWFKYKLLMAEPMSGHDETISNRFILDFRHMGVPMSRRFRAMKLYMVIRDYGVEGLRAYIRRHIYLAKLFEKYLVRDPRFEIPLATVVGLTSFRLVGPDEPTTKLLEAINTSRKLHMVPSMYKGQWVIRFGVGTEKSNDTHIQYAYDFVSEYATCIIREYQSNPEDRVKYAELIKAQEAFEAAFERKEEHEWDKTLPSLAIGTLKKMKDSHDRGEDDFLIRQVSVVDNFFDGSGEGSVASPKPVKSTKLKSMCVIS